MCTGYHSTRPADMPRLLGRRGFLKAGAAAALVGAAAGLRLPAAAAAAEREDASCERLPEGENRVPAEGVSIQLYTLRNLMSSDLDGVFAGLAEIGYRNVEHAGFHGRSAREFKAALDAHGLRATSGHQSPYPYDELRWRRMIDDAYTLGQRYMVDPLPLFALPGLFAGVSAPSVKWGLYAQDLNKAAEIAKIYGIEFGYHNHDVEFLPLPDDPSKTGYDILLAETDPELVHFELDIYWSWKGEQDPVELFQAHPTRFRQFHVKDMDSSGNITDPGKGVIDFARIFSAAHCLGITEYIIEQDNAGQNAMTTAQLGYDLLRGLRW